jgi:hypothetical protein
MFSRLGLHVDNTVMCAQLLREIVRCTTLHALVFEPNRAFDVARLRQLSKDSYSILTGCMLTQNVHEHVERGCKPKAVVGEAHSMFLQEAREIASARDVT